MNTSTHIKSLKKIAQTCLLLDKIIIKKKNPPFLFVFLIGVLRWDTTLLRHRSRPSGDPYLLRVCNSFLACLMLYMNSCRIPSSSSLMSDRVRIDLFTSASSAARFVWTAWKSPRWMETIMYIYQYNKTMKVFDQ